MLEAITVEDFESKVLKVPGPVVVDFSASWCEPCRALKPVVERAAKKRTSIPFYTADADDVEEVMGKYGLYSLPTVALFKGGKLAKTMVGLTDTPAEDLDELLQGV